MQLMPDEEKLPFLTWHQAAWNHGRHGDR